MMMVSSRSHTNTRSKSDSGPGEGCGRLGRLVPRPATGAPAAHHAPRRSVTYHVRHTVSTSPPRPSHCLVRHHHVRHPVSTSRPR